MIQADQLLQLIPLFGVGIVALIFYVAGLIWVYRDAEKRGESGWFVASLVALIAYPAGLIPSFARRLRKVRRTMVRGTKSTNAEAMTGGMMARRYLLASASTAVPA